ncbi:MAG: hypothetical protein D6756_13850 [Cyanobacteria bacterium J083]|nr:MAG: hypothetical protein D6756_13850 [Cyanobacteria bacterium J083]
MSELEPQSDSSSQTEQLQILEKSVEQLKTIIDSLEPSTLKQLSQTSAFAELAQSTEQLAAIVASVKTSSATTPPTITQPPIPSQNLFANKFILGGIISAIAIILVVSFNWSRIFPATQPLSEVSATPEEIIPSEETPIVIEENSPLPGTTTLPEETIPQTLPEQEQPGESQLKEKPKTTEPQAKKNLKLTPEQSLIAAIQTQVAEISQRYSEDLISTIEADFLASRLLVKVTDEWQELEPNRKKSIANEMLRRSRSLDFKKLEIINEKGELLARSPVVGKEMVIFDDV